MSHLKLMNQIKWHNEFWVLIGAAVIILLGVLAQASQASSLTSISTYTNPDGLIGYWDFAQCTGTSATDRGDWSYTGTITSGNWLQGKYGCGLKCNTSAYVSTTYTAPSISSETMSFWLNLYNTAPSNYYVFAGSYDSFYFNIDSATIRINVVNTTSNSDNCYYSYSSLLNTWHYISATYTSGSLILYVDGVSVCSRSVETGSLLANTHAFYVCSDYNGGQKTNGTIDEVKIWNRALSAEEVYVDYLGTYANIEKYYQGLTTSNITLCATATQTNQISTDVNTTKSKVLAVGANVSSLANLTDAKVWAYATRTLTDYNQTDIINFINSAGQTIWTYPTRELTGFGTLVEDIWDNALNRTTNCTNCETQINITVNDTNTTNNYNNTINNSYPITLVVNVTENSTNSTINNTFNYSTLLDHAQIRNISKGIVAYWVESPPVNSLTPESLYTTFAIVLMLLFISSGGIVYLVIKRYRT